MTLAEVRAVFPGAGENDATEAPAEAPPQFDFHDMELWMEKSVDVAACAGRQW